MPLRDMAGRGMAQSRPPSAGGFLIAIGALGGAGIGFAVGEPTRGFLIGLALSVALSLALWWRQR